jgi:excisionase family DNA binding protein
VPDRLDVPQLFTTREAAKHLRLSERSLWSITQAGKIPVVRIGRRVLYDSNDLRHFIEGSKQTTSAEDMYAHKH